MKNLKSQRKKFLHCHCSYAIMNSVQKAVLMRSAGLQPGRGATFFDTVRHFHSFHPLSGAQHRTLEAEDQHFQLDTCLVRSFRAHSLPTDSLKDCSFTLASYRTGSFPAFGKGPEVTVLSEVSAPPAICCGFGRALCSLVIL